MQTRACSNCHHSIPADPEYVNWCDQCSWNVLPILPEQPATLLGRAYQRLSQRLGPGLFNQLRAAKNMQRQPSGAAAFALLLALAVHLFTLSLMLFGLWMILATWFTLATVVGGLFVAIGWLRSISCFTPRPWVGVGVRHDLGETQGILRRDHAGGPLFAPAAAQDDPCAAIMA